MYPFLLPLSYTFQVVILTIPKKQTKICLPNFIFYFNLNFTAFFPITVSIHFFVLLFSSTNIHSFHFILFPITSSNVTEFICIIQIQPERIIYLMRSGNKFAQDILHGVIFSLPLIAYLRV